MGLLLSVLVTCLGVVELLTFYSNVKRRVNHHHHQPVHTALGTLHAQYLKELEGVRDRLENQLEALKKQQTVTPSATIPTLRLNSHEDIDIEFNEKAVARSRSPSPRRCLVSENKNSNSSAEVTEEPQALHGIKKSKAQECLPEFLIEEQESKEASLKNGNEPISLPLPEKSFISEPESEPEIKTDDVFRKKMGHTLVEVDGELYYRRSPSPFPSSFDLTAPRNSVCSELLDDAACVLEVDESSRSNSHSPQNVQPTYELSELNAHVSKSDPLNSDVHETLSDTKDTNDNDEKEEFMEVETFTEEMKNSLDGVDKTKGCIKKKYVQRKRIKNRPKLDNDVESPRTQAPKSAAGPKPGEPFWVNR